MSSLQPPARGAALPVGHDCKDAAYSVFAIGQHVEYGISFSADAKCAGRVNAHTRVDSPCFGFHHSRHFTSLHIVRYTPSTLDCLRGFKHVLPDYLFAYVHFNDSLLTIQMFQSLKRSFQSSPDLPQVALRQNRNQTVDFPDASVTSFEEEQ